MVISHILGGMGNQLFQYAAGRSIAAKYNVPLKIDLSDFKDYNRRGFDLDKFNTHFEIASDAEIQPLKPVGNISIALQYLYPKIKRTYHRESVLHYDKNFEKIGPSVYLKGYFQNEGYFAPIADIIKQELVIDNKYISRVMGMASQLQNENSVSIHIRRGDYTSAEAVGVHPVLTADYYKSAIELICRKIPNPVFYFFSDDLEWTKQNLSVERAVYVTGIHSNTHLEDFHLMSHCQHNIIANSSFSWWCAWLNNNSSKTVIAPKEWFTKGWQDIDDRTPNSWLRI